MSIPMMTQDVALQLEQANVDYVDSWVQSMQAQMSQAVEIDILRIKNVRAFVARDLQEIGLFNQVIGLGSHDKELLKEIMRFYHDHGVEKYRVEINPYHVSPDFLASLASCGFSLSRFETHLYGVATTLTSPATSTLVTVREITPSELDLFATLHIQGYQEALTHVSKKTLQFYYESLKGLYERPGWHLYLAWVNDTPGGMGMLYIQNGKASLAGGATLSNQRRQGVQTALLHHRVQVAAEAQCTLIVGQTSVGSISQHNMERLGMRTAYTGTIWKLP